MADREAKGEPEGVRTAEGIEESAREQEVEWNVLRLTRQLVPDRPADQPVGIDMRRAREPTLQLENEVRRDPFTPLREEAGAAIAARKQREVELPADDARRLERGIVPCLRARFARDARQQQHG